jgi:hypothetical protein
MGVIYSYYDQKRHIEFEMGKWYTWDDEAGKEAVKKLFLPREELAKAINIYLSEYSGVPESFKPLSWYAYWLADKLIEFRDTSRPEDFLWINDSDDSDDVTLTCGICHHYLYNFTKCTCPTPKPCKVVGSRYTADYNSAGRYIDPNPEDE